MGDRNICKFALPSITKELLVKCFIFETNADNAGVERVLLDNRMILATKGELELTVNDCPIHILSGEIAFAFKGERLRIRSKGELALMYIEFSGDRGDELMRRFDVNREKRVFRGFDGLIPLWQESVLHASEETVDLAAESILLYTFSRMSRYVTRRHELVDRIIAITEENFTDPDLSVSSIAAQLSYNPKYISHAFKEKMGVGYSDYLCAMRIKYAVALFDHGIDSVKNVAILSGFTDPLYFSTVFKKNTGMSPKEYKNK